MTDLMPFAVLVILLIYLRVHNAKQSSGHSTNYNQKSVPLIRPEEFATLQQPVLYAYKLGVAQVDKAFWFKDARMKAMVEN